MDCPTAVYFEMDDLVRRPHTPATPICNSDTKRHAVYFPPTINHAMQIMQQLAQEDEDDTSSFMFRAPRSVVKQARNEKSPPSNAPTPAQEIVNRYRAGLLCHTEGLSPVSPSSSPSSTLCPSTSGESTAYSEDGEPQSPPAPDFGCGLTVPKIRFRQSRFDALDEKRAEALKEMEKSGVDDNHALVCPRAGCRETLSNVKALTFHLHLHDMEGEKTHACDRCSATLGSRRGRKAHVCGVVSCKSTPTSPIVASFGTILSRFKSLN
ncbi:hypothetical protein L218DRAFT_962993 [Marasmius fiardii PR-910]|nr:hypothetical protein L218DRAFT_962993 [Marasmius fiardii PR-910]